MRLVPAVIACCALVQLLGGCSVRTGGSDSVSQAVGSDFFGAGGMLNLTEPVAGDAFLAGGHIAVATEVKGDLIAAGGQLSIGGNVGDDLYAAGGNVKLDAIVTGNARVAGGEVEVGPATVVAGSLSLTGGSITFDGDAHGYLYAAGGRVTINGIVHGDAQVRAEEVVIGPEAHIGGRLVVYGAREPAIPQGAVIGGGVEFHEATRDQFFEGSDHRVRYFAHGVGRFLWFVGVFFAGALFVFAFPRFAGRAADTVGREPLKSLGLGFVVLACAPVLGVLLLVTVIGIPLALLLVPAYLLLLFLGWVTAALFLGQKLLAAGRSSQPASTRGRLLALLLALVLLWLIGHVPFVGRWARFAVLLAGTGAVAWQAWSNRDRVLQAAT